MLETHDDIIKAQTLYHKLAGACGPKCFRKLFTDAIQLHTLDEFYPVVVRAELSAAVVRAAMAKEQDNNQFDLYDYLEKHFGLKPRHLVNLTMQTVADIMEKGVGEVEEMFRKLDFTVENGAVTGHPDAAERPALVEFASRVRRG